MPSRVIMDIYTAHLVRNNFGRRAHQDQKLERMVSILHVRLLRLARLRKTQRLIL